MQPKHSYTLKMNKSEKEFKKRTEEELGRWKNINGMKGNILEEYDSFLENVAHVTVGWHVVCCLRKKSYLMTD